MKLSSMLAGGLLLVLGGILAPTEAVGQVGSGTGQNASSAGTSRHVPALRQRLLHRFDENGNGRLDHRESRHALRTVLSVLSQNRGRTIKISDVPAGLRPIFALFDRNRDGVLGPLEQMNLARAMPHAARPDHKHDRPGKPGEDRRDRPQPPEKPKGPGDGADGEDSDDRADRPGGRRPRPPRLTPEVLRQLRRLLQGAFDRNNNGRLDPPERCQARRATLGFLGRHRGQDIDLSQVPSKLGPILALFDFNKDSKLGPLEQHVLKRALQILLRPRPRPEPPGDGAERPQRPRPDDSLGDELDESRPERPSDGGFEVRPGRPPRPDF